MKTVIRESQEFLEYITPGEWQFGGPVKRDSIITGHGLSESCYEIGANGELFPPGIAVVNTYYSLKDDETTHAFYNAAFIAAAPRLIRGLLEEIEALHWRLQPEAPF